MGETAKMDKDDDPPPIRLHNLPPHLIYEQRLTPLRRFLFWLTWIPFVNIALTPLFMKPDPDSIQKLLSTMMIVNSVAIGRIFQSVDLSDAGFEDAELYLSRLSSFSKVAINSFMLNIILLTVVVVSNPRRNKRRAKEVWLCLRFGVVTLMVLSAIYIIQLYMLYEAWGEIVYGTGRFMVFSDGEGIGLYAVAVTYIIIACVAVPGEAVVDFAEELLKENSKTDRCTCPFIRSLTQMPATRVHLAMEGLTLGRLKPYKDNPHMLFKILTAANLPTSDCLDVIAALQDFTRGSSE
ncbi:unnamed protein product [Symbiodinium sp. CCMP2592]|nr:unnamed protein product [Symbiodinium sp. CCMP2592]